MEVHFYRKLNVAAGGVHLLSSLKRDGTFPVKLEDWSHPAYKNGKDEAERAKCKREKNATLY